MAFFSVPFINDPQEELFWCWAAVAANTYNSMLPPGSKKVKQCEVVALAKSTGSLGLPDPCSHKASYASTLGSLSTSLNRLGIRDGAPTAPAFQVLADALGGHPAEAVCADINFPGYATHSVAVSAVDTDTKHVWVEDPVVGAGNLVEFTYADFASNYGYHDPNVGPACGGVVGTLDRVKKP